MPQTVIIPYNQPSVFASIADGPQSLRLALVRPDSPPPGVAGFLFDIDEDSMVELSADITDHYVENNTALQDHIALRPVEIETNGCVGELVQFANNGLVGDQPPGQAPATLADNPDMTPELTLGADEQVALNTAVDASEAAGVVDTNTLAGFFGHSSIQPPEITRQSNALLYFFELREARMLFTLETPWGFWTNMAILSIQVKQGRESKYQSDFTVRFKQVSLADSPSITLGSLPRPEEAAGRQVGNAAAAAPVSKGTLGSVVLLDAAKLRKIFPNGTTIR